ncbi:MAG: dihydropteroate synthase [Candidatus Omnitrophica bacterium]|nr:dihydropteroate synthase [Candidatus Omnitrophota bacterium]MBD3268681.1 dihydropteroate synthase [Candidatus Omnitrophota bacterium]
MKIVPVRTEKKKEFLELLLSLGVSKEGAKILLPKGLNSAFKIEDIKSREANIIKQHLLSLGSDAGIERKALVKDVLTSMVIFGNLSQLNKLCEKLKGQPFGLREVAGKLKTCLQNKAREEFVLEARDKILRIKKCVICGIINTTPDSFSGDGLLTDRERLEEKDLLNRAESMIKAGAKIIDIGGESTRPFSKKIDEKEEKRRVIPALRILRKKFPRVVLSVDTYKYPVARAAVNEGVDMINDITALKGSSKMADLVERFGLGCVLMHMKGTPRNMQKNPSYRDVVSELVDFFESRLAYCQSKRIDRKKIMVDPGIGFGKRFKDNTEIIKNLDALRIFGLPVFIGMSRKSFIGEILKNPAEDRLTGSLAACAVALARGANVLRVHDVKESSEFIKVFLQILNS